MKIRHLWIVLGVIVIVLASVTTVLAQERTHTVQPGETLYSIARYYGVTPEQLAFVNGITNPDLIYVGQVLLIPEGSGGEGTATIRYTVVAGDTLFGIARRFGTTVQAIVSLNRLPNANVIYVGQVLLIPAPQGQPTAAPTVQPTSTQGPQQDVVHVVQRGETLSQIALRYGTTYQQIALLNNLTNPNLIYAGQRLIIRRGSAPTVTPTQPTATSTAAITASPTGTAGASATPTTSPTGTQRPTNTPTPTFTPSPAQTVTLTVGATPTLTPTASPTEWPTPTPLVPDVNIPANAPNLFANPGFEGVSRAVGDDTVNVLEGWEPFYCDRPYTVERCPALRQGTGNPAGLMMGRPIFEATQTEGRVHGGQSAQRWSCNWLTCRGGVFQTVRTTPGATCVAGAYVQSWSTNAAEPFSDLLTRDQRDNSLWIIRVDLAGGTAAFDESPSMLISRGFGYEDNIYDQYTEISYVFVATGQLTTVFFENLRLWPLTNNSNYLDDAYLRCTQ